MLDGNQRAILLQTVASEPTVTRLPVAIKHLLNFLTQWGQQTITSEQVIGVYSKHGNDFNATAGPFERYGIII